MARKLAIAGLLSVAGTALLLGGCMQPQIPVATGYPRSEQPKIQAVHHWEMLAQDFAGKAAARLLEEDRPVFVERRVGTPFFNGFHMLLVSALMQRGVPVATTPEGALLMTYDVQVVHHDAHRPGYNVAMNGGVRPTNSEVIITAEIAHNGTYLVKATRVFYVNGDVDTQFVQMQDPVPIIEVERQRIAVRQ